MNMNTTKINEDIKHVLAKTSLFIFNEYGLIGGICSLLALLLASHQIIMHLYFFNDKMQLYIVRILLMVPIYSIQSWLSLIMPKYSMSLNIFRDIYEAYVIYIFLQLLIQFLQGEDYLITTLNNENKKVDHIWPVNYVFSPVVLDGDCFRRLKQGVLQFVLIKPLTAVLSLIFYEFGLFEEGNFSLKQAYIYISGINNFSVSLSMYCLILFYISLEDKLKEFRPLPKFFCIKFVIFFSFWQTCSLVILWKFGVFSWQTAKFLQDMLICFEMVIAAIAHSFAFSYKDFIDYSKIKNPIITNLGHVLNVKDLIVDVENTFISKDKQVLTTTAMSEFPGLISNTNPNVYVNEQDEESRLLSKNVYRKKK